MLNPLPKQWEQGDHLALIGQTKSGKSTLAAYLLQYRKYLIVYRSKTDPARKRLNYPVEVIIPKAQDLTWTRYNRFELRPPYDKQRIEFAKALDITWKWGGFCNYLDETFYIDDELKLRPLISRLMTQGSGKGITMACGIQRPVGVTRFVLSQSLHIISFHMEGRDVKELEYATNSAMADAVETLGPHEFAWYQHGDRDVWVGKLDLPTGRLVRTR